MVDTPTNLVTLAPIGAWDAATHANPSTFFANTHFPCTPTSSGADPQAPANALAAAYEELCTTRCAGEIHIWPGRDWTQYRFDAKVVFDRVPVKIVQHAGAVIELMDSAECALEIGTRVEWVGFDARFDVGTSTPDRALVKFRSNHPVSASIDSASSSLVSAGGSWLEKGWRVGEYVELQGYGAPGNSGYWIVVGPITGSNLPVVSATGGSLTTEGATGTVRRINSFAGSRICGGKVSVAPRSSAIPGFRVFDAQGLDDLRMASDLSIRDVSMEVRNRAQDGTAAVQQTHAWTGGEYVGTPNGIGFFRGQFLLGATVLGCKLTASGTHNWTAPPSHAFGVATGHYAGILLDLDSCYQAVVDPVIAVGVSLAATTGHEALPLVKVTAFGGGEGGHCTIGTIHSENVLAKHALWAQDVAWLDVDAIRCGRWSPGKTTALVRLTRSGPGCRAVRLEGISLHNVEAPQYAVTFTIAAGVATGTGIGRGMKSGDFVYLTGFSEASDGSWELADGTGDDQLVFVPGAAPLDAAGSGDETARMEGWILDAEGVIDLQFDADASLRRSSSPPFRLVDCSRVRMPEDLVIDSRSTYS